MITSLPAPAGLGENQLFEITNLNSALFPNLKTKSVGEEGGPGLRN